MRVLFIGLGSIGQRNLGSCLRVRPHYRYAALRSRNGQASVVSLAEVEQFESWGEVEAFSPELVWICNPTSMHLETLRRVLSWGDTRKPAIFMEKPLAHEFADVRAIQQEIRQAGIPFFYGCLLRQHPLVIRVKELLESGSLGRAVSYSINCGSYLPDWRPGRDYRQTYSAFRSKGGGVALDLIHEFDYASYWFGCISEMKGWRGRLGSLEIDSDDVCCAVARHVEGALGQVTLNYLRAEPRRDFEIILKDGLITGCLITGKLRWVARPRDLTVSTREEMFVLSRDALHDRQSSLVFETLENNIPGLWQIEEIASLMEQVLGIDQVR